MSLLGRLSYRGTVQPELRVDLDQAAIDRLFDPTRDPSETVRRADWHPTPASGFFELDLCDTVATRRRWFENLIFEPSIRRRR
jgi:hypothetical protein